VIAENLIHNIFGCSDLFLKLYVEYAKDEVPIDK
jgi:hypothetical protein